MARQPAKRAFLICSDSTKENIPGGSSTEEQRSQPPRPSTAAQCSPIICSDSARPPDLFSKYALRELKCPAAWRLNMESVDFAKIVWLFRPFISPVHRWTVV